MDFIINQCNFQALKDKELEQIYRLKNQDYLSERKELIEDSFSYLEDRYYFYLSICFLDRYSNYLDNSSPYTYLNYSRVLCDFLINYSDKKYIDYVLGIYDGPDKFKKFLESLNFNFFIITPFNFLNNYCNSYFLDISVINRLEVLFIICLLSTELTSEIPSKIFDVCFYTLNDFHYYYEDTPILSEKLNKYISDIIDSGYGNLYRSIIENNLEPKNIERNYNYFYKHIPLVKITEEEEAFEYGQMKRLMKIGKGSYGNVYKSKDSVIKRQALDSNSLQEIGILKFCKSDNIISLFGVFLDSDKVELNIEEMGHDLYNVIHLNMDSEYYQTYISQICSGILYLHQFYIVHGDLKPENILVSSNLKNVKIIDFGLSTRTDIINYKCRGIIQSFWYRAPEVFMNQRYTIKADIWSLAIIVINIITHFNYSPFGYDEDKMLERIMNMNIREIIPENSSHKERHLLNMCLIINAEYRANIYNILNVYLS